MDLKQCIYNYDIAIVSIIHEDYPISFPVKNFEINLDRIILVIPMGLNINFKAGQKACILFHTHDKYIKNIRYVRLKGYFSKVNSSTLEFKPLSIYSFRQGGLINTLRFIWNGKRKVRKYLRRYHNK